MEKLKNLKKQWILSGILIAVLLFLSFTSSGRSTLSFLERTLGDIFSPVQNTIGASLSSASRSVESLLHFGSLLDENKKLQGQVDKLKEENRNLKDIIGRSSQLTNEATILKSLDRKYLEAYIVSKTESTYFNQFSLNKGLEDGIEKGDTVVIATESGQNLSIVGLVGKVEKVSKNWCKVQGIIDEGNAVSFRTIRNSEGGIVKGSDHRLEGYAYDLYGDIVEGDEVYTSGIGDLYERDIYIGKVEKVINDSDKMIKNIRIEPAVNFHKLYKVYVITESNYDK